MSDKELIYLKGWARGRKSYQTLCAINAGNMLHAEQKRKDGDPFFYHGIRVASELVALGVTEDNIIAAALLHDVFEDCDIIPDDLKRIYGISDEVIHFLHVLNKKEYDSVEKYYEAVSKYRETLLVKISDRCHNISTMTGAFSNKKMREYIEETHKYVIPLCKYGKNYYPEYSDQIFVMKYHIESLLSTISFMLNERGQ